MSSRDTIAPPGGTDDIRGDNVRFVLASGSKRRRDIMDLAGLTFIVQDGTGGDAEITSTVEPEVSVMTQRNAEIKLGAAIAAARNRMPWNTVLVSADTAVSVDGTVLGKPADRDEAVGMLNRLRGREHEVVTTVAMTFAPLRQRGVLLSHTVVSQVMMRDYTDDEVAAYVSTGTPYDRAGAYGVQDAEFDPAVSVAGCYLNVVGLPLCATRALLPEGACTFANAHIYATCAAHEERTAS
jgi:MAF protein